MKRIAITTTLIIGLPLHAIAQQNEPPQIRASTTSSPKWEVCNETSYIIRMASTFIRGGKMAPKGWDRLIPGQCKALNAPAGSPRYIFAESTTVHQGGIREWAGTTPLCVSEGNFQADATKSCQLQNLEERNYIAVDPSEQRTTLIEPDNFGTKAAIAGTQRLLRDNGFKVTRIDGLTGRRTSRSIRDFKKKAGLKSSTSHSDLINALAKAAKSKQTEIGLNLCNNSTATIWSALATRDDGTWKSKGWWTIPAGNCLQPYTKSLKKTEAHFFALQENIIKRDEDTTTGPDKRLRSVSATPSQFCIAEAKFSALGRDYCTESGYAVANFRPLPTDKDGIKVNLTDQDFAVPNAVGLR